ncbi:hypothetical protein GUJ93_ZPchr0008g11803 [Zizania palustris]|uniref:Uncharacterized protein n=1 Tax=Zizania palustris TaxID=103762 RepID=A0A8J5RGZ7_ZIZPA|nr:hypothetical protein GUJ93_ZPchr0008g11803 [Zizania palustris]
MGSASGTSTGTDPAHPSPHREWHLRRHRPCPHSPSPITTPSPPDSTALPVYPSSHGLINNYFPDPISGERFTMASHDPKRWLGEPLWVTSADQGVQAATYFWTGAEITRGIKWVLMIWPLLKRWSG